ATVLLGRVAPAPEVLGQVTVQGRLHVGADRFAHVGRSGGSGGGSCVRRDGASLRPLPGGRGRPRECGRLRVVPRLVAGRAGRRRRERLGRSRLGCAGGVMPSQLRGARLCRPRPRQAFFAPPPSGPTGWGPVDRPGPPMSRVCPVPANEPMRLSSSSRRFSSCSKWNL